MEIGVGNFGGNFDEISVFCGGNFDFFYETLVICGGNFDIFLMRLWYFVEGILAPIFRWLL